MYLKQFCERFGLLVAVLVLVVIGMAPSSATAIDLMVGLTNSDVGLNEQDNGLAVSAVHYLPMGSSDSFEVGLELVYLQRAGSQPGFFSHEILGVYRDEGKVRLHVLQPGITLGYSLHSGQWGMRLYAGGALGLKVSEAWDLPEGDWGDPYTYENMDYVGIVGLSTSFGQIVLDVRYCAGLTEQLILTTRSRELEMVGELSFWVLGQKLAG